MQLFEGRLLVLPLVQKQLPERLSTAVVGRITVAVLNVLVLQCLATGGFRPPYFFCFLRCLDIGFAPGGCI